MASDLDPYQTLGVSNTATQEEIKNAYRSLAKKYHPDLNPGKKEAEQKFKNMSVAYELIGTPEARKKYDQGGFEQFQTGSDPFQRQRHYYYQTQQENEDSPGGKYSYSQEGSFDEDLFETLFGKTRTQTYRLDVDLKDIIQPTEKEITLPSGKKLRVKIPAGIKSGTRLRFASLGLFVEILVRPDPRFKIEGDQLSLEVPVSLSDAVLGGEIRVPTLDGEVMLKVPPHSNTGTRLRLNGKGLFNRSSNHRGDEIVILKVTLPDRMDSELENAIRKWKERQNQRGAA